MYIKENIPFSDYELKHLNLSSEDIELQCIMLMLPKTKKYVVLNVYRPPSGNVKNFCEKVNFTLDANYYTI